MKINKRLSALSNMVEEPYSIIWDCCCDHGLLGMSLLSTGKVKQVHFVDIVPTIIETLSDKMTKHVDKFPAGSKWRALCCDVSSLDLSFDSSDLETQVSKQLVILSGVGGDLLLKMIEDLITNNANLDVDFLLCPVQHTYKVRQKLQLLNFKLKQENLLIENGRGYEMLLVNKSCGKKISSTGDKLWLHNKEHKAYLMKLISHYQRVAYSKRTTQDDVSHILKEYKNIYEKHYC